MAGLWKADPTSWRTTPRPKGWKTHIRPAVIKRDGGRCTWIEGQPDGGDYRRAHHHPERCPTAGTDVDHVGAPDDHSVDNLRLLCPAHHDHRSAMQGVAARGPRHPRARPAPRHPGLKA